ATSSSNRLASVKSLAGSGVLGDMMVSDDDHRRRKGAPCKKYATTNAQLVVSFIFAFNCAFGEHGRDFQDSPLWASVCPVRGTSSIPLRKRRRDGRRWCGTIAWWAGAAGRRGPALSAGTLCRVDDPDRAGACCHRQRQHRLCRLLRGDPGIPES